MICRTSRKSEFCVTQPNVCEGARKTRHGLGQSIERTWLIDAEADRIEAGEEEEVNPEQLKAEAENAHQIAELLKRHDAGSLSTLFKRYGVVIDEDDDEDT